MGKAFVFGDNIDTDRIIPGKYVVYNDEKELAKHAMEGVDPMFSIKVKKGDIIVAGKNWGCGSSREHAVIALKAVGVSAIIAKSFARIFYRNAINLGLPLFESPEAAENIKVGDEIEFNLKTGRIKNLTTNRIFYVKPLPVFILNILNSGGLVPYLKKELKK